MISPLDHKLPRGLSRMKGQVLAVSLVMACGLAMMITTRPDGWHQRFGLLGVWSAPES